MTILDEIAEYARERVKKQKEIKSLDEVKVKALSLPKKDFAFEKALKKDGISFNVSARKHLLQKELSQRTFPIWTLLFHMRRQELMQYLFSQNQNGFLEGMSISLR